MKKYEGVSLGDLPAHVFGIGIKYMFYIILLTKFNYQFFLKINSVMIILMISTADNALRNLRIFEIPQSIILSGVSGSGKTENAKYLLQFFSGTTSAPFAEIISDANALLEAFGNSSTAQNLNSSRFIKLIQVTKSKDFISLVCWGEYSNTN